MLVVRYVQHLAGKVRLGALRDDGVLFALDAWRISDLLAMPLDEARAVVERHGDPVPGPVRLLPPVDGLTEVWASGVTYRRSREARVEESSVKDVYTLVYDADRPELFFKSVAWRVVGDREPIGIRADSALNVPEPELALVANSRGELFGLTVCNDVSSRSIEGENPLYLPQAKIYAGACALGPGIRPIWEVTDPGHLGITVLVERHGTSAWSEATNTALMHRPFSELLEFLFRADTYPEGAVLSTGTGLVPGMDFTLETGDVVTITIDDVGTLTNRVAIGPDPFTVLVSSLTIPHLRPATP
jgi:2-dehydro-3-deoxy-D-arabinonate dehydratase